MTVFVVSSAMEWKSGGYNSGYPWESGCDFFPSEDNDLSPFVTLCEILWNAPNDASIIQTAPTAITTLITTSKNIFAITKETPDAKRKCPSIQGLHADGSLVDRITTSITLENK